MLGGAELEFVAQQVGQRGDAGVEHDVAHLGHGVLLDGAEVFARHALACDDAHDLQALVAREDQQGVAVEGAAKRLAHAVHGAACGPQLLGGFAHGEDAHVGHRQQHFVVHEGAHGGGGLAYADVEDLAERVDLFGI
jgi:hypothetical protein